MRGSKTLNPPRFREVGASKAVTALLLVSIVGIATVSVLYFSTRTPGPACDSRLTSKIGAAGSGLCLRPMNVTEDSNFTHFQVPVLVIQPGSTGTIDILYDLASGAYVSHPDIKPNMTATIVPLALSVATAKTNASVVGFSPGTAIFHNNRWVIFRYAVSTSSSSTGYYAILPRFYWGKFPALAVGANPESLNLTSLAMWGYTNCCISGEVIMSSTIVGAAGFTMVNATVPGISYCPNAACNLVSRSLY